VRTDPFLSNLGGSEKNFADPSLPLRVVALLPCTGLPLEVLEQILSFSFLCWSKLIPASDLFNLNNTSHLLLVSKGFRLLCLPLFYKSVTITRRSHYTTFFNPERGIFVTGDDGKKPWSYVREVSARFQLASKFNRPLSSPRPERLFPPLSPSALRRHRRRTTSRQT